MKFSIALVFVLATAKAVAVEVGPRISFSEIGTVPASRSPPESHPLSFPSLLQQQPVRKRVRRAQNKRDERKLQQADYELTPFPSPTPVDSADPEAESTPTIDTVQLEDLIEEVNELTEEALEEEAHVALIEEQIQADEAEIVEYEESIEEEVEEEMVEEIVDDLEEVIEEEIEEEVEEEMEAMSDVADVEEEEDSPEESPRKKKKKEKKARAREGRKPKPTPKGVEGDTDENPRMKKGEYRDQSSYSRRTMTP